MDKISSWNKKKMREFLFNKGLMSSLDEVSDISIAGEGNMNCTLRVEGQKRNFIIKQSPPYCEKYPQIPAPQERTGEEFRFYRLAEKSQLMKEFFPEVFFYDQSKYIVVMEDLGSASDFEFLYTGEKIDSKDLKKLVDILSCLHFKVYDEKFSNANMRKLNFEYIFDLPYREDDEFNPDTITPGLLEFKNSFKNDPELKSAIDKLGKSYLKDGQYLVHGDFYPRSWIKTNRGLFIIDPEFGYLGLPEFDLGVLMAHMIMAKQGAKILEFIWNNYRPGRSWDAELALGFCGAEMIRRILHVAQLPLDNSIQLKSEWLQLAKSLIIKKDAQALFN